MFDKKIKNNFLNTLKKIRYGQLYLTMPEGEVIHFKGDLSGCIADISMKDWRVPVNLMIKGDIGFAEDYRDGYFETNNLVNLIQFGIQNESCLTGYMKGNFFYNVLARIGYLAKRNNIQQSKKNIQAHYDLGNDFYSLWLDPTMTYSSGIYHQETESLETAQRNKYKRILDILNKKSGSLLEIGCGWGGFIEEAMHYGDYQIKGITLSKEQQLYSLDRLKQYAEKVDICLEDYRHQQSTYDMIVSIEMLEAVGQKYWPVYFKKIKKLLSQNGKAVIQTIVIDDALFESYAKGTDVIRSFIFPGGMLPSVSILKQYIDKNNLRLNSIYSFGLDYAKTLSVWLSRFSSNEDFLLKLGFDKRFQRMWKFYLSSCIAAFKQNRITVVQLEIENV